MTRTATITDGETTAKEFEIVALRRSGKPEEAASLVAFLLGDESQYISGAVHSIDGG